VGPELLAAVRYFGRYRTGWIRNGVLLSVGSVAEPTTLHDPK